MSVPKTDWYSEGLPRVKARLSMILQRWKTDITVSQIEKDISDAHAQRALSHPLKRGAFSRPSVDDARSDRTACRLLEFDTSEKDVPPKRRCFSRS